MYQTVYCSTSTVPDSVLLKPEVLIIGGGVVGMTVARELARGGMHAVIAEREESLGGGIRQLRYFYDRPTDVRKWIGELTAAAEGAGNITVFKGVQLKHFEGQLGRFQAVLTRKDGSEILLTPSAVVVALGCVTLRSDKKVGEDGRVVGLTEMENLLAAAGDAPLRLMGQAVTAVTYYLDRTNDDIKIHTVNAIKQAIMLREKGCQAAVVARDLKVSVSGMERLYRRAREKGVMFYKYDEPPILSVAGPAADGRIKVEIPDMSTLSRELREIVSLVSDIVVISETLAADPTAPELYRLLRLRPGRDGMLMDDNPQLQRVSSNRRGIFLAGACRFPQVVTESLTEAHGVVQEIKALLHKGVYTPSNPIAEVDPRKCAVCYACARLCPHAAIAIEKYGERNVYDQPILAENAVPSWAARVEPAACFGCGVCIAECPAKAITLYTQA